MSNELGSDSTEPCDAEVIADRYEVLEQLGRGGMAVVFRVRDRSTGREVALKRLLSPATQQRGTVAALFEREFLTLTQLQHPHVIAVYDYGLLSDMSPYYTMELLDGGDLREHAPVPWRQACELFFEVCSSLALLHSRRLLHRDISPRNIRCTRDEHAKLIDFGAMASMSDGGGDAVGTPAFVAPETVHRLATDARTDLFSLGVTLYYALTARLPYPARSFAEAIVAWGGKVAPPSSYTPAIPAALDDLVLTLISPEAALRPGSAFEVMQRLLAIAGRPAEEVGAVSAAYLTTPTLVGRQPALQSFREHLLRSRLARGGALMITGAAGMGRSRLLDACALDAKTLGFTVVRASGGQGRAAGATARALMQHLLEALPTAELSAIAPELLAAPVTGAEPAGPRPELKPFTDSSLSTHALGQAVVGSWLRLSRRRPLVLAVDDVQRIDAISAGVLAALLDKSRRAGIFVLFSADSGEPANEALSALARRCEQLSLRPLTHEQTHQLLGSVFGDVSNLDMLAREVFDVALGNPRQTLDLAQHLVDRGTVRYCAGTWTLPQRLSAEDLPRSASEAMRARIDALSADARWLAEVQACAFHPSLRAQDFHALAPQLGSQQVERAVAELLAAGVLNREGDSYRLANRLWLGALQSGIGPEREAERHRALAALYEAADRVAFIYHAFAGGLEREGHAALAALNAGFAIKIDQAEVHAQNIGKMMQCYPRAFESAARVGVSLRALNELRRWNFAGSTTVAGSTYPDCADAWRAQLVHDSGLDLYRADPDQSDPMQRLMRALQGAQARQQALPEAERVYSVEEALRLLAEYVVFGIALGARSHDVELLRGLPELLEPFIALSPLLEAIWDNARATLAHREGELELARTRWLAVLAKLDAMDEQSSLSHVKAIANAVAFGIGNVEAQLGLPSATSWADRLDRDPAQRISALQLRRIVRLEQGDGKGAERLRREAEVLTLQAQLPQMFSDFVYHELLACAHAGDLAGVQEALERVRPLAAWYPGWRSNLLYGEACFHRVRGDHAAVARKCQQCIELTAPDEDGRCSDLPTWLAAEAELAEARLALGEVEQAHAGAARALERWRALGRGVTIELERPLALAEAKLGMPGAAERLEALIAFQDARGVTGLRMGLLHEARARIAIWQSDAAAFERHAERTAREYRHGAGSALGARYDRLLNEATRHGLHANKSLMEMVGPAAQDSAFFSSRDLDSVMRSMSSGTGAAERVEAALALICAARRANSGHLFLRSEGGLSLRASRGEAVQAPDAVEIESFVMRMQDREDALDDMATGELPETQAPHTILVAGDTRYELLLLSYAVEDALHVAGVAAVAANDTEVDAVRQTQLLSSLAQHLVETA